jgi:hypothetical protein
MLAEASSALSRDILRATSRPGFSNPWDAVDRYLSVSRIVFRRSGLNVFADLFVEESLAARTA